MKKPLVFAFLLAELVVSAAVRAALPPGFSEHSIPRPDGAAWNGPAGLTFSASGRMFVWERDGKVWIVDERSPVGRPFLDISDEVGAWRDHGLLGFALHPDFDAVGHFYLLYIVDRYHLMRCDSPAAGPPTCGSGYDPAASEPRAATLGRLVRYTAVKPAGAVDYREAVEVDPASRRVLIGETLAAEPKGTGFPLTYESHGAGSLLFGEDGMLLASFGDGASHKTLDTGSAEETYFAQALADGILRPKENIGSYRAQLVDSLNGKIVRLDPETGAGVPDNPFYDPAAPRAPRSRVWALGLRNPFRMALRGGSGANAAGPGAVFIGDVGSGAWEELSVALRGGQNFGWPAFEGMTPDVYYLNRRIQNQDAPNPLYGLSGCTQEHFYFQDLIQEDTQATPSWPNPCDSSQQIPAAYRFMHSRPALDWNHDDEVARWPAFDELGSAIALSVGAAAPDGSIVRGEPFRGNTSVGGVWYTGTDFPATYQNTYFQADFGGRWIRSLVFDANNNLQEVRPFLTDGGWVVSIATNPIEGALYYIGWAASVRKITYEPVPEQSLPPLTDASVTEASGLTAMSQDSLYPVCGD